MRTYQFPITLQGQGVDADDAWDNALELFVQDPGTPLEAELVESDDDPTYPVSDW